MFKTLTGYVNISNRLVTPDSKVLAELDMYLTSDQYRLLYPSQRYDLRFCSLSNEGHVLKYEHLILKSHT